MPVNTFLGKESFGVRRVGYRPRERTGILKCVEPRESAGKVICENVGYLLVARY